ncbi:GntR family transcriptional regulator [Saccharibacillus sp. CPCC 101409]|uniref:GntR family transcriptional regulator n=1 Tax=Saccharibacillus sp. CPCC 101409 TaxID=3058041 RepID=UPI002671E6AE|nr:GntR family transcriptional regulator [Saccharibacillus sp. CPCC 101409]MDO3409397.1 GntR family transcriptional regulator [Saccharibacillus sp. CPCC 101409]
MPIHFDENRPIFQQIAERVEDDILNGTYGEEDQIVSTTQFSRMFQINPATVVKGFALLVNEDIIYKKRGLGMYVAAGAKEKIMGKRRKRFYNDLVVKLLEEAEKLQLTKEDVVAMIQQEKRG